MKRKSFILYLDLLGSLDELSDEQAGRLFKAIRAFHMSGSEGEDQHKWETEFEGYMDNFVTKLAFHPFRAAFERDADKYQSLVERNRKNGKKGGRKRIMEESEEKPKETQNNPVGFLETQRNPKEPKQTHNDNDNDNDNDIILGDSKESPCQASRPDPPVPFKEILDFWNHAMEGKAISGVSAVTPASKRGINVKARFKEYGLEKIYQAVMNAAESAFLNGHNQRGFKATFDWVFLPSNFIKVLDGNYADSTPPPKPTVNENNQTDRLSARRGTEPRDDGGKNAKGAFWT